MTAPNNQPAPEGFRRLSSKWLETNPLPGDARYYNVLFKSWESTKWAGYLLDHVVNQGYTYYTARTDLPREAYADSEPGAEVASERAEVNAPTLDQYCGQPEGSFATFVKEATPYALEKLAERDAARSELATLRAQLDAKVGECQRLAQKLVDENSRFAVAESAAYYRGRQHELTEGDWIEVEKERDKLRAEVEELKENLENSRANFRDALETSLKKNPIIARLTDAVRKERDEWAAEWVSANRIGAERYDAAQARCGELENLAIGILRTLDAGCEVLPSDMQRWWAALNLTPSQQPDNLDSSGGIGRRTSNEADRLARADDSMGVQVPPAVNLSRPEPVKAGELDDLKAFLADAIAAQIAEARRWEDHYKTDPDGKIDRGFWEGKARAYEECLSLITDAIAPEGKATEGEG